MRVHRHEVEERLVRESGVRGKKCGDGENIGMSQDKVIGEEAEMRGLG
jgi:hypothetical protein